MHGAPRPALLAVVLSFAALIGGNSAAAADTPRTNFVFILVDDKCDTSRR